MKTYYIFGDSLMRGVMPDEKGNYHSSGLLGFEESEKRCGIRIKNFAMPTFTSAQVKQWMTATLAREEASDVAILECGGNDCDYKWKDIEAGVCTRDNVHRQSLEEFEANYDAMLTLLESRNIVPVVAISPRIDTSIYKRFLFSNGLDENKVKDFFGGDFDIQDDFVMYVAKMKELADKHHCEVIDFQEAFVDVDDKATVYSVDGLHPNEAGYARMKRTFDEFFDRTVTR